MRKIPTLFRRDPDDRARVIVGDVTPGCEWVLAGEGVPTRKWDGTCTMLDTDGRWWARREVKPGKTVPPGWVEVDADPATGRRQGWEPIESSPFAKQWREAVDSPPWEPTGGRELAGTYELVGPKINGNPEGLNLHTLIRHGMNLIGHSTHDPLTLIDDARDYGWEGIVWWRDLYDPDCDKAKLKVRDMPDASW